MPGQPLLLLVVLLLLSLAASVLSASVARVEPTELAFAKLTRKGKWLVFVRPAGQDAKDYDTVFADIAEELEGEVSCVLSEVSAAKGGVLLSLYSVEGAGILFFTNGRFLGKLPMFQSPDAVQSRLHALDIHVYVIKDASNVREREWRGRSAAVAAIRREQWPHVLQ